MQEYYMEKKATKTVDAAKTAKAAKAVQPEMPSTLEAAQAFVAANSEKLQPLRQIFQNLGDNLPQVLILEGGEAAERLSLALWLTAKLNCSKEIKPCLHCPNCLQVGAKIFNDLYILDGQEGSIKIESVRELKPVLGQAPRGNGVRVVILAEAQALGLEAANSLLKVLEEPKAKLLFLLLAPSRERLLPTLISRSWCLTLPWPALGLSSNPYWESILSNFLQTGQGLFEHTATKGQMTPALAREILLILQKFLVAAWLEQNSGQQSLVKQNLENKNLANQNLELSQNAKQATPNQAGGHRPVAGQLSYPPILRALSATQMLVSTDLIAKAQTALDYTVNPALVINGLAIQLSASINR